MAKITKEHKHGATFRGAATAASVGGATYAAYRYGSKAISAPSDNAFTRAAKQVRRPPGLQTKADSLAFLQRNASFFKTNEGAEVARQAWINAVKSTEPNVEKVLNFAGDINTATAENVYSQIEQTLQRNESLFINKVSSRFRINTTTLKHHQKLTGSLPRFLEPPEMGFIKPSLKDFGHLPPAIQSATKKIQEELGAAVGIQYYTRPGWEERGLGMYQMNISHALGNFSLNVPMSSGGMLAEGKTQSSLRVARGTRIYDMTTKALTGEMSPHEFLLHDLVHSVIPGIKSGRYNNAYQIKNALTDLYEKNIYSLESIPNLPYRNKAWENIARIKGQGTALRIYDPTIQPKKGESYTSLFRNPESREFTELMRQGGLFPSTSPTNLAEGIVSTYDASQLYMVPEGVDSSRRPMQALREWKATPEATKKIMKTPWSIFETQQWRQDMVTAASPWFKTLYVDPKKHPEMTGALRLGEGESALVNNEYTKSMTSIYHSAFPVSMKPVEGLEDRIKASNIAPQRRIGESKTAFKKRIRTGDADTLFREGEILGETTEGEMFTYKKGMKLKALTPFHTEGKGSFYQLAYDEQRELAEAEHVYGGTKGMQRLMDEQRVDRAIARETHNVHFQENVMKIVSMDELKKATHLHNTQMITSLWDILDRRMKGQFTEEGFYNDMFFGGSPQLTPLGKRFYANPVKFAKHLKKKATINGHYNHEKFIQEWMTFATHHEELAPEEFASVFGAVPGSIGEEKATSLVESIFKTKAEQATYKEAMLGGFAGGVSQSWIANVYAGGKGSIEPRIFDILQSGQYGKLGEDLSTELSRRAAVSNPESVVAYEELTQTLQSIAGKVSPQKGDKIYNLANKQYEKEAFQNFIEEGGGWLRTAKYGINDIHVPGAQETKAMVSYKSASGEVFKSKLASAFHNYARSTSEINGHIPLQEDVTTALENLTSFIAKEQAPAGQGAGAFLRAKKLLGSRILTGVSEVGGQAPSGIFGELIPEQHMKDMIDEMIEVGAFDSADKEKLIKKAFDIGLPGMTIRHPATGQYSAQPVILRGVRGATGNTVGIWNKSLTLELDGQRGSAMVTMSSLAGHGGDLDADPYHTFLVSPNVGKSIEENFLKGDNAYKEAYVQHTLRSQLVKAKASNQGAGEPLTVMEKMIADAKKLGTAQQWTPMLSTELSKVKAAAGQYLTSEESTNARWVAELAENIPISGKHLDPRSVLQEEMSHSFQTLASSLQTKNAKEFSGAIKDIFKNSDQLTQDLLTNDVNITNPEAIKQIRDITGLESFTGRIKGMNIDKAAEDLMYASQKAADNGVEEGFRMLSGSKRITTQNLAKHLAATAELTKSSGEGVISKISAAAIEGINKLASAGRGVLKYKKAIGFGFAGALALGAALSSPKETIGPSIRMKADHPDMNAGKAVNRMTPDQIVPPQKIGNPTVPGMMTRNSTMIAPGGESARMSIQARGTRANRMNLIAGVRSQTGNRPMNVNVRDNSSSLSVHKIINKVI